MMHRPNYSMPLPSMQLDGAKEQQQPFGLPIVVTTPCDEEVGMTLDVFAEGLAPMAVSPPRTPMPKIAADFDGDLWKRHSLCSDDDEEMTRPSSAASMYSSSSACSFGSMTSFNSFPSAGSPRHEKSSSSSGSSNRSSIFGGLLSGAADDDAEEVDDNSMDLADTQKTPRARRPSKQDSTKDADWSKTFDLHLWGAYISYQSNPTVTPFYVPPGGCPPIGVCIRVAREAKRTWRVPKSVQETDLTSPTERLSRSTSSTLLPADAVMGSVRKRRASRGHVARKGKDALPRTWPYSEAATRQRLRILSRRITENPHLQTRHGRLASPIHMKDFAPPCANIAEESQYSTRSLSFSLVTSTSESMQSDGPLASLSRSPFGAEEGGLRMPQGDVPLAHDVFKPTLEPSYEVDDELEAGAIPEGLVPPSHRRSMSSISAHRRSGSKNSILHRKTDGSNGIGHRRTTSATGNTKPGEQPTETFATPRKRTRARSSSDATIRSSIPRMLCLGSPFGAVEEEGNEASRHARRSIHKRHQSLETSFARRAAPPTLMPPFDFTKQEAYQNAIRQQEQEKVSQPVRPASTIEGKRKDHFFDDLFGNASRTNLSERSSTPSVNGSDGASIRVPSKKIRSRGMSFTDRFRGNGSNDFTTPANLRRISVPSEHHLRPERQSVLKRLGSPFRDSEFAPLDSTLNQSQTTLQNSSTQDLPATAGLGSAFTSPPRPKKRDTTVTPSRERGILGFGLGFFRRGKKDASH
ncbi:hypothetical protein TWF696_008871 [Orbilia brochopaga]|uniref:Uncharacterized protein n=1 Tax=Orbilia brochopaga TaxID=3140254 RepID=A0AAV9UH74_9PEZI